MQELVDEGVFNPEFEGNLEPVEDPSEREIIKQNAAHASKHRSSLQEPIGGGEDVNYSFRSAKDNDDLSDIE